MKDEFHLNAPNLTAHSRIDGRPLRVLSLPGKNSSTQYLPLFCRGLEDAGIEVIGLRDRRLWLFRFDIIHFHFPAHYIAEKGICYSLARSAASLLFYVFAKTAGRCRIVYTVHDVVPFEPRHEWFLWPYLRIMQRLVDGYVFLSDSSQNEFFRRFPDEGRKPWIRIDHGSFPTNPKTTVDAVANRDTLFPTAAGSFLVGFLGSVKAYKGIEVLPTLPRQLQSGTPVRIVVAGGIDRSYHPVADPYLQQLGERLIRIDTKLSDAQLNEMIQSVDVVFLPYTRGWNSGMIMLALGMQARVLAMRRPLFEELQGKLGEPWIYTFDSDPERREVDIKFALERICHQAVLPSDIQRLRDFLEERSFVRGGELLRVFYLDLLRTRGQGVSEPSQ